MSSIEAGKTGAGGVRGGGSRDGGAEASGAGDGVGGTVYLVGAGPGDPGLMTLRAADLIRRADAIFYDRLIPAGALSTARPEALKFYVGKSPRREADSDGGTGQEEINRRLIAAAGEHEVVVRLKGGDPFVFGRGGEEAAALRAAGVPFEVVPGVTAGVAGPASAGIPVTHRGTAGAVAFVTGHPAREETRPDLRALATFPGTLVFYMGVRRLAENCEALIAAGRDPAEPAAIIEAGTLPRQRVLRAELGNLALVAAEAEVRAPALVVCGEVARLADDLAWFEPGPLAGRVIAVTRARAQAGKTAERLRTLGAEVVELPTIRIVPRLDAPEVRSAVGRLQAGRIDLVTLTSVNGADLFFEALARADLDARALAGVEVAAIGSATVEAIAAHGIRADHVPVRAITESLIDCLDGLKLKGRNVLVAGATGMRPTLAEELASRGATVERLELYETLAEPVQREQLEAALAADFVTLASASAARNFARAVVGAGAGTGTGAEAGADAGGQPFAIRGRVASIGPITSAAAREAGLPVDAEAEEHTIEGLINTLLQLSQFEA